MTKPIVKFKDLQYCLLGGPAVITPINHPNHLPEHNVSNTRPARTSEVLSIQTDKNGVVLAFETRNTKYELEQANGESTK